MINEETISQFLKELITLRGLSPKTISSYKSDILNLKYFLEDINKKTSSKNISKKDINDYFNYLYHQNIKRSSMLRKISSITSFFKYLHENKQISENPISFIKRPNPTRSIPKNIPDNYFNSIICEIEKNKNILSKIKNKLICYLLYYSGLRVSEAISINLKSILHLSSANLADNQFLNIIGKGKKERMIPIPQKTVELIKEYLAEIKKMEINPNFVFFSPTDYRKHISRESVNKMLFNACLECGIPTDKVSPHKLRHSFATNLFKDNVNIRILQELLGHSSINTTSIYISNNEDEIVSFVNENHPFASLDIKDIIK